MKAGKKRVVVGISGGVDSAVATTILKQAGWAPVGVFLDFKSGQKTKDLEDVRAVCQKIGIPLKIIRVQKKFEKEVVGYFLKEYQKLRTPNPCVFCNEKFKFKILFEEAQKLKIDWVATGHYAQILKKKKEKNNFKCGLFRAKDKRKDQSYFLYRLSQKKLQKLLFPLGEKEKEETRKIAREMDLPVSEKKDSQDICFLQNSTLLEFLEKKLKTQTGRIINEKGEVVGEHKGLVFYTLGQRKRIEIGGQGPYYVAKKISKTNELLVTNKPADLSLFSKVARIEKVKWISSPVSFPTKVLAQTRYHNPLVRSEINCLNCGKVPAGKFCEVEFEKPQRAITPGQSLVFYSEAGEVLGGGIIAD